MPSDRLINGLCLQDVIVAYTRDSEGYKSKWYDATQTADPGTGLDTYTEFTFTTPAAKDGDIYSKGPKDDGDLFSDLDEFNKL